MLRARNAGTKVPTCNLTLNCQLRQSLRDAVKNARSLGVIIEVNAELKRHAVHHDLSDSSLKPCPFAYASEGEKEPSGDEALNVTS
jgi:hypothetical protein